MSFEEPPTLRNGYGLFNSTWPSSSAAAAAARAKAMRDPMEDDEYLTLVWQGEEYKIKLPNPEEPLSVLRKAIDERTGVAPEHQKLLMRGVMLRKDLPLKTYGLVRPSQADEYGLKDEYDEDGPRPPNSSIQKVLGKWGLGNTPFATGKRPRQLKLTLIGSPATNAVVVDHLHASTSSIQKGSRPEHNLPNMAPMSQVASEATITAQIKQLLDKASADSQAHMDSLSSETPQKTLLYLSEILLQTMLKLDSLDIDPSWQEARKARKEGIKSIQARLDQVDAVKDAKQ
ncbi:hypothetical protein EMMF5_000163 [Cystobasidiomycetes sp. EMM_F5]